MPKIKPTTGENEERERVSLVENKYLKLGFTFLNRPEIDMPRMPEEMTNLSANELGNYMSTYSAWREYTEDLLMSANLEVIAFEEEYRLQLKKDWITTAKRSGQTVKDKEKEIDVSEDIVYLRDKFVDAEMYRDMLASKFESINNAITVLSREITRRLGNRP